MCGCGGGSPIMTTRQNNGEGVVFLGQPVVNSVPCEYDSEQLKTWREKLVCAKDKAIYQELEISATKLNKYIGVVLSAINYNTNPCYFKKELDEIADFMGILVNNGKC